MGDRPGALPNLVVIGAMKCGTTSLHRYLDAHPEVTMAPGKELNYFFRDGNLHRGRGWYRRQFDPTAPVRGESSPGYTSPDHPEVAFEMAALIPDARLVYAVRDPVARAVSQWRHHRDDGAEQRPLEEALPDEGSQYLSRSRYLERLQPFLDRFDPRRIHVVVQEELLADRRRTLARLFRFLGVEDRFWDDRLDATHNRGRAVAPPLPDDLRRHLEERLRPDAGRFRELVGRDLPWPLLDSS